MVCLIENHFDEIYLRLKAYAHFKGHYSPEDIASQAITVALSKSENFEGDLESLIKYMISIMYYDIIDSYRKSSANTRALNKLQNYFLDSSFDDLYFEHENFLNIIKNVKDLTPQQTNCLIAKYFFGLSDKQSSQIFNIKPTTVRVRRSEALKKIRNSMVH